MIDTQISISEYTLEDELTEENIHKRIQDMIQNKFWLGEFVKFDVSEKTGLKRIMFNTSLACNYIYSENTLFLKIRYSHRINNLGLSALRKKSEPAFCRIKINSMTDIDKLQPVFLEAFENILGNDFGCCAYFVECSDAKQCVIKNKQLALGCCYLKNLSNGRIFYGKNKNI